MVQKPRRRREAGLPLTPDLIQKIEEALHQKPWTFANLAAKSGVDERTIQSWLSDSARRRAAGKRPLRPRLLLSVLETLGLTHRLTRRPGYPQRRHDSVDVFLAAPMESLGKSYQRERLKVLRVVDALRNRLHLTVFYAGEDRLRAAAKFEDEAWAMADNCDILERARRFVLIYPPPVRGFTKPLASSALVETGYALAMRVPVLIFFRSSHDSLPFLLRMLPEIFEGCHLVRYRGVLDIISAVIERQRPFFPDRS